MTTWREEIRDILREAIGADQPPDVRRGAAWLTVAFAGGYLLGYQLGQLEERRRR